MATRIIGSIVLAGVLMAIPILAALSFVYSWDGFFKLLLTFLTLFEFIVLADRLLEAEV